MTSFDPVLSLLSGGAVALGVAAAQIGGPLSLNWRPRFGVIHGRLSQLTRKAPAAPSRIAGAVLVAGLLAGGTFAAYAAEPSAPERLAGEAAGVVGSGDQLSLRIKEPGGERTVKVGETYDQGWMLRALTPTKATLVKDGETREVGLNPTGVLASAAPAAAPSTVDVAGMPDAAIVQAAVDRALAKNPKALETARHGQVLSLEEGSRMLAYADMIDSEFSRRTANDNSAAARTLTPANQRTVLGEAGYNDYWDLTYKVREAGNAEKVADLAARPFTGPTSYYIPAGAVYTEVERAQGVDTRGIWSHGAPDAQGGSTVTLIASTPDQVAAYYQRTTRAGAGQTFISKPSAP